MTHFYTRTFRPTLFTVLRSLLFSERRYPSRSACRRTRIGCIKRKALASTRCGYRLFRGYAKDLSHGLNGQLFAFKSRKSFCHLTGTFATSRGLSSEGARPIEISRQLFTFFRIQIVQGA